MNHQPYNEIITNLFIGDMFSTQLLFPSLALVVNCTRHIPNTFSNTMRIPVDDSPEYNNELFNILTTQGVLENIHYYLMNNGKVLVHCHAGMQRSCAVVACYLIKYYSLNPEQAINYIKSRRNVAFHNHITFMECINHYYLFINNIR